MLNEDAISGLSPGRIGQVLYPWFDQDRRPAASPRTRSWSSWSASVVKFTSIDCFASAGVVGGVLSGNTFNNVSLRGPDRGTAGACNRLEYLILEAGMRNVTPQPTLAVLYDEKLPEDFLMLAMECIKTGAGYPAFMNDRVAMEFLLRHYGPEGMTSRRRAPGRSAAASRLPRAPGCRCTRAERDDLLDPGRRRPADLRRRPFRLAAEDP